MKFTVKLRKAIHKLVALIPPHRRYPRTFHAMYHPTVGKSPLDCAVEDCYLEVLYQEDDALELDEFFKWAQVQLLNLDVFFLQASYPTAPVLELDLFFKQAAIPEAQQYQLDVFFEHAALLTQIATEVKEAVEHVIEATIETIDEEDAELEEVERDLPAELEIKKESEKEGINYPPLRMTRSMSCSMQAAEKPIKYGLTRTRSSVFV